MTQSTSFDVYLQTNKAAWEGTYIGFSPMIEHQEEVGMEGIVRLIRKYPSVTLSIAPGDNEETIELTSTTLNPLAPDTGIDFWGIWA